MHDINLHRHFRVFDVGIDLMLCFDLLNEINIKYPFGYTFLRHVYVFVLFTPFFFFRHLFQEQITPLRLLFMHC